MTLNPRGEGGPKWDCRLGFEGDSNPQKVCRRFANPYQKITGMAFKRLDSTLIIESFYSLVSESYLAK